MQRADCQRVRFFPLNDGHTDGLPGVVARKGFRTSVLSSISPSDHPAHRLLFSTVLIVSSHRCILNKNGGLYYKHQIAECTGRQIDNEANSTYNQTSIQNTKSSALAVTEHEPKQSKGQVL